MRKVFSVLVIAILLQSCNIIKPYWDKYFGADDDPMKEEVLKDKAPPANYDPVFILGEKSINGILEEPKMVISRVDPAGDKVKVYFHIVDESLLMQGGADMEEIWCEVTDTLNGESTRIENFRVREVTEDEKENLAIALVMDHSGSMGEERAKVMQESISEFIRDKFPNDLIGLIRYDHRTVLRMKPIASEMDLLMEHEVDGLAGMGGGTKTVAALKKAVKVLSKVEGDYQKLAIVFTDGINSDISGLDEMLEEAQANDVIISGVDYGYNVTPNFLDVIAKETNGIYHHIYNMEEFNLVFDDLYYRMNNYYVLEYDQPEYGDHSIYIRTCLERDTLEANYAYNNVPRAGEIILLNVYFDTGKSTLKKSSEEAVDRLENLLALKPEIKVQISGHTDNVGNDEKNQNLSEERALAVKEELIKRGISEERIKAKGFGESEPIADNNTADGRAKNRRVEFQIIKE